MNTCSEWILGQLAALAHGRSRLWLSDPDRLLPSSADEISSHTSLEQKVLLASHSLALRRQLADGLPSKWVLIDHAREDSSSSRLFAPDLRRLITQKDVFRRTIRDYLVDLTDDSSWPQDVESFPYRELARENPIEFLRAYDDFRAGKPHGFSSHDLLIIGATAVFQRNLFSLTNAFHVLELAFHSESQWQQLEEFFGNEEVQDIRKYLRGLPKPLGDLFGKRAQSARLACIALIVLSRHLENPSQYLTMLSPTLSAWQDSEPILVSYQPPTWFQSELDLLDSAITEPFLKTMKQALKLADQEAQRLFAHSQCWSRKLRELVIFNVLKETKSSAGAEDSGTLERLVPEFRSMLIELQKLCNTAKNSTEQLRAKPVASLRMEQFIKSFRDQEFYRIPILSGRLKELQNRIWFSPEKPPGFEEAWNKLQSQLDAAINSAEQFLKDFDFALGRFLEAQYQQVVPSQILPTNQLIEKRISPEIVKSHTRPRVIVLLDGMRYDLWREIVRPHLERRYVVEEEMALAMLPSETRISRVGFFSGLKPKDYFSKPITGGEFAACNTLLKKHIPGQQELEEWDVKSAQASFAFRSKDRKTYGVVFDFADAVGHASAWEIDLLADMVQVWLKKVDQAISTLPKDCDLWITADHGQVISGAIAIEIPQELLSSDGNGYRAALIKNRLFGQHANHVFYLRAKDLGYDDEGFWAFPKPGYSFKLQPRKAGEQSRFKPTANLRHGGLSSFEVFVPLARLTSRTKEVKVKMVPKVSGLFKVGLPSQISVEISADSPVQGQIELMGDVDGLQPVLVSNVGPVAQIVHLPFVPSVSGSITLKLEAQWGYKQIPYPTSITLQIEPETGRPTDGLDEKLKKLFG